MRWGITSQKALHKSIIQAPEARTLVVLWSRLPALKLPQGRSLSKHFSSAGRVHNHTLPVALLASGSGLATESDALCHMMMDSLDEELKRELHSLKT